MCPTTVFAAGGTVLESKLGNLTEDELRRRRAGWWTADDRARPERGWVDHELAAEFPELGLTYAGVDAVPEKRRS